MTRRSIPADRLAALGSRVSMPSLVAEDLPLQRAGRGEYLGLCPFHSERTPSFRVYRDHGHCYGCGWHGDPLRWLMEYRRLGFLGAVHCLSSWAGCNDPVGGDLDAEPRQYEGEWQPVQPVPPDAPELLTQAGLTVRVFNPKRAGERWEWS